MANGRNILIAMDGSKHAENAFTWYVENVHKQTDNVIIAFCVEPGANVPTLAQMKNPSTVQALMKAHDEEVSRVLNAIDDLTNKYKVKHRVLQLQPPAGEAIVKAAEEQKVEFIVVGSRGLGTIRRTIMGSVSDYIVHHSHVPVFICKHSDEQQKLEESGGTDEMDEERVRKILIAMDGSKHSEFAFEWYAKTLYRDSDHVIIAYCAEHFSSKHFHTQNSDTIEKKIDEHDNKIKKVFKGIEELANKLKIGHIVERLQEPAGESIIRSANQQHVDLIIIGSRGAGTAQRTFLGSTCLYVVHHSHIPVLVCKHRLG